MTAALNAQVGAVSILQTRGSTRTYTLTAYEVDDDGNVADVETDLTGYTLSVEIGGESIATVVDDGHWTFAYTAPESTGRRVIDLFVDGQLAATGVAHVTSTGTASPGEELSLRLLEPSSLILYVRIGGGSGAGVTDGDKGDVEVSGTGTVWTVPALTVLAADLAAETSRAQAAEALLVPLTQKGAAGGVATLDGDGKVPSAQIPPIALSEYLGDVAGQAAMLALSGQRGDWCVRTEFDPDRVFILKTDDPTQAANWSDVTTPGSVVSVAGKTGVVTLVSTDLADFAAAVVAATNGLYQALDPTICQGRLTLTSGTAVTTSDVTAATSLYFTPFRGAKIATYSGTAWTISTFTEKTLSLSGLTADTNYDVFIVDGTLALEAVAWTNATTRATALVLQDGVYVKSGATTRRYLGTFRTTGITGQTEDSISKRFVWNHSNRLSRQLRVVDTTDSWTYATSTWRSARGSDANRVSYVAGLVEETIEAEVLCPVAAGASIAGSVGIGVDQTAGNDAQILNEVRTVAWGTCQARYRGNPGIGYHFLQWVEFRRAGTFTYYGDDALTTMQSGLTASILA